MTRSILLCVLLVSAAGSAAAQGVNATDDKQPLGFYATGSGSIMASPNELSSNYLPGLGGGLWAGYRIQNRVEFLLGVELLSFGYDGTLEDADGGAFKPLLYSVNAKYYLGPPRRGSLRMFASTGLGLISLAFNDIRRDGVAIQSRATETKPMLAIGGGGDIELSDRTTLALLGRIVLFDSGSGAGVLLPVAVGFRFAP